METWPSKQPEKMPHTDAVLQAMEKKCAQDEARLSEKFVGWDMTHTRGLLAQTYSEVFTHAKDILEGKT
ncbi:hypothetical protein HYW94_04345 [Candidatus Uhrbacteria bacterium]|nr:hypothetical protein [Candidatus Uhrbacteria bacterium]